jgi:hypothetical protein
MKQLLLVVTLIVLSLLPYKTFAQVDITIKDPENFVLQTVESDGSIKASGNYRVELVGIYESIKNQYAIIYFDNPADTLVKLKGSLDRTEFRNEFTKALNKKDPNTVKTFSEYSINIVFMWLYSLRQEDKGIISGRLNLGTVTQPFENTFTPNTPNRVRMLERLNNRYLQMEAQALAYKTKFLENIDTLKKAIRKQSGDEPFKKSDTSLFTPILDLFKKYEYPVLDSTLLPNLRYIDKKKEVEQTEKDATDKDATVSQTKTVYDSIQNIANSVQAAYTRAQAALQGTDSTTRANLEGNVIAIGRALDVTKAEATRLKNLWEAAKKSADISRKAADSVRIISRFLNSSPLHSEEQALSVNAAGVKINELYTKMVEAKKQLDDAQKQMLDSNVFPIKNVSLQFERGHIERIQVWVQNRFGGLDIYENIYAIGFSSINNLKAFQSTRLFIRKSTRTGFYDGIFLSDVLGNYDNMLDLFTRDYSPADTVINELSTALGPITLHKERNVRLFDSKIFTDLQGIQADAPNGLVQVEVNRKFNLNTFRRQVGSRMDISIAAYMNVFGAINKIENKSKELVLRNQNTVVNNVIVSPSYATNLDIRQYENASLGVDLNAFLFDWPDLKFTGFLDAGVRYGHLNVLDTVYAVQNGVATRTERANKFTGNTFTISFPKITFEFFSERRVGFNMSYNYNHTYLFTNNTFKQIVSYAKSDLDNITIERNARKSHMMEVFLRAETSRDSNGQLFLRSRFFWQQGDANTFFPQIQVGYAYNIIFRK